MASADAIPPEKMLDINSEHRLRSENLPFDIDVWYPLIANYTFRSAFFPLDRLQATAVLNYQRTRFLERHVLTGHDVQILQDMEKQLDVVIREQFGAAGAFFRLCGRSPKDGEPRDRAAVWQQYTQALEQFLAAGEALTANTKLRAISRTHWLHVRSGADVMSLMLTSERIYTDLHDWLEYGTCASCLVIFLYRR